ncbi:hypothetical protein VDGD_05261 [Verticillium dahliae]|nr:hypothetical protein VDGD_05261 [Verticillium dahliae]
MTNFFHELRLGQIGGLVGYDNATVIQRPSGVESSSSRFFLTLLTLFLNFCLTLAFHLFFDLFHQENVETTETHRS